MSSAFLVRLRPTGPWRIGPDSGDRDRVDRIFHSDALYAAVTSAMARLGLLEDWLDATARASAPVVRLSSCFPFHGEMLYVIPPRHVWPPAASAKVRWKGAKFVPLKAVETLLAGQALKEDSWMVDGASECLLPSSSPAGTTVFRASVRSNAAMDRGGEAVTPHSTACLEFAPGSGLWFVAVFADDAAHALWAERLRGALRLLADTGMGGGRSRGWGRAEMPEIKEGSLARLLFSAPAGDSEKGHWMLSLFHPSDADSIDWERGNYSLTTRSGRSESDSGWGAPKKQTRMVAEGSVLVSATGPNGSPPVGSAPDVAPEGFAHPVFRAGFAVSVPVPLKPVAKIIAEPVEGGLEAAQDFSPAVEQPEPSESEQRDDSTPEATLELKSVPQEEAASDDIASRPDLNAASESESAS
jgi:CRISPR type III-A-associated RAMP protein Csm4